MVESNALSRIAVIGGGKMGEAMLGGWIAAGEGPAAAISGAAVAVADPGEERRAYLEERYGVSCVPDARELAPADLVVLSVKPQVMMGMLATIRDLPAFGAETAPLYVSVAAGISTARLEEALPYGARVVRVMPNTPLLVGAGASVVAGGSCATERDVELVRDLFAALGEASIVDEADIDAIGAVSGSGPAYVAAMIEALRDAGAACGLDAAFAERLALQTVYGTARLMRETGQSAEQTRIAVCSPGGTTLAALAAMDEAGLSQAYAAGVNAAVVRSKELGAC